MRGQVRNSAVGQLTAALIGGGVVAAVLLASGFHRAGEVTTVIEQLPGGDAATTLGLTPRQIYARDARGVVFVRAKVVEDSASPFDIFPTQRSGVQTGSGFVIRSDGTILTNAHVIAGAVKITVEFAGGSFATASVIGTDPDDDLALLKVDPPHRRLDVLALGNSNTVEVGDPTVAIGNPFQLQRTLTTGVVSALQRQITAPNGFTVDHVIQTDAPINPGNSGGPLINAEGQVIAVNSQIQSAAGSDASIGIGFAIPINTAKFVIPQLEAHGRVVEGYLGVQTISVTPFASLGLGSPRGVLIESVAPRSPAARAGLRGSAERKTLADGITTIGVGGDIITSVDGKAIAGDDELAAAIFRDEPGQRVTLGIVRGKRREHVEVTLGTRPESLQSSG